MENWLWHKGRDVVTVRELCQQNPLAEEVEVRAAEHLALEALTRQALPSTAPLLWRRVRPMVTAS
ncbi:hypothetical protein ABGB18_28150 [Nonomuraea sp. B12E4]|uniref:hypothetical protein n=1 Tax=Nonomuraea sp. B12E4 TaxID=3153564 RepID=UPI00325E54D2